MSPTRLPAASLLAVLTAVAPLAGNAHAESCGMGDIDWYATERANVARADEMLQEGDTQKAAWLLQRTWPRLREARPVESSLPVIAEGVRLMALAAVRSEGNVRSGHGWSSWTVQERSNNVSWGVARLRMIVAANPSSNTAKTDLGEALSRSAETQDEARTILESLEASQEITSPQGFAALAVVRSAAGEAGGAELATAECELHASNVDVQCAAAIERIQPTLTATR